MDRARVLVVGSASFLQEAAESLVAANVAWEQDFGRALDLLVSGPHDIGLIGDALGGGLAGVDLIREATARHSPVPLILVTTTRNRGAQELALAAGAVDCVDLSHAQPGDLGWSVAFAHATRISAEQRNARQLKDVSSSLAHEGKNVLAAIGGAVEVLSHGMPPSSQDHAICTEIRERLSAFRDTIDAMTLAVRMRVPLREAHAAAPRPSTPSQESRRAPRSGRSKKARS